jgi:hypothetical protein
MKQDVVVVDHGRLLPLVVFIFIFTAIVTLSYPFSFMVMTATVSAFVSFKLSFFTQRALEHALILKNIDVLTMGVASFSDVLHQLEHLTLHQVYQAAKKIAGLSCRADRPTIYVDASCLK